MRSGYIENKSFVKTPSKTRSGTMRFWELQAVTLQTLSLLPQQVCTETASCIWSSILAPRVTHVTLKLLYSRSGFCVFGVRLNEQRGKTRRHKEDREAKESSWRMLKDAFSGCVLRMLKVHNCVFLHGEEPLAQALTGKTLQRQRGPGLKTRWLWTK